MAALKAAAERRGASHLFGAFIGVDTPAALRGMIMVGVPIGTPQFVAARVAKVVAEKGLLRFRLLRTMGDERQVRYQLLRYCAVSTTVHLARQCPPHIYGHHTPQLRQALHDELVLLCDLKGEAGAAPQLSPAAVERSLLPTRLGGLGVNILDEEGARAAALCAVASGAGRMEIALVKIGGWRPRGKEAQERFEEDLALGNVDAEATAAGGYGWAIRLCRTVTNLFGPPCCGATDGGAPVPGLEASPGVAAAGPSGSAVPLSAGAAPPLLGAPHASPDSVVGICRDGEAAMTALRLWRMGLDKPSAALLKRLTTREIQMPEGVENIKVEQTLPTDYANLIVASQQTNLQHSIGVFLVVKKVLRLLADADVDDAHKCATWAFLNTVYGDAALKALPSDPGFEIEGQAFAFLLRHLLQLPVQLAGVTDATISDFFSRQAKGKTNLPTWIRHNQARDGYCTAAKEVGATAACPEPAEIVECIEDKTLVLSLDGAVELIDGTKLAFDLSFHHGGAKLAYQATKKKRGHGSIEKRANAKRVLAAARRALKAAPPRSSAIPELREAVDRASTALTQAFHPGYAAACRVASYLFHAITLNEYGGYSADALGFLAAISHKGDKLKKDKEGERFFHESMTFVSTKSRAWILQRAGVARACGMYRGAAQAVTHTMRSAADAFPRAFSYDSSGTA